MSSKIEQGILDKPHLDNRPMFQRVYDYIVAYKRLHDGNTPAFREIMNGCQIASTSTVVYHLNKLEEKGLIRRPEPALGIRYATKIEVIGGKWSMNG